MSSDEGDQSERQFWDGLEFCVSREMQKQPMGRSLGLWCDGFIPEHYLLDQLPRRITGLVWIGMGPRHQETWKFSLVLPPSTSDPIGAVWSDLLPISEASGWLVIATEKKEIEVRLGR